MWVALILLFYFSAIWEERKSKDWANGGSNSRKWIVVRERGLEFAIGYS